MGVFERRSPTTAHGGGPGAARGFLGLAAWVFLVLCLPAPAASQTIRYGYDDLGRLVWVQDQTGEVAIYVYDPVGNILQIVRGTFPDPTAPVGISAFTPGKGAAGTAVTIFGRGFDPTPAANAVTFGGARAAVTAAAPTQLTALVPPGASTGPIAVTAPAGTGTSAQPFTVLQAPQVAPATAALFPTMAQIFTATQPSQWRANNIVNGNALVGTLAVAPDGLSAVYTAPAAPPPTGVVAVTAAHRDDFTLQGAATVEVLPSPTTDPLRAPPVSVARAPGSPSASPLVAALVSVGREPPPVGASPLVAALVSVGREPPPVGASPLTAPLVATAREPVVTAVTPAQAPRGTMQTLVLRGAGLSGATAVAFNVGTSADSNITVNSFTVDSSTQITANITIAPGAPVGLRVARVTAAGVTSSAQGTAGNLLEVLP